MKEREKEDMVHVQVGAEEDGGREGGEGGGQRGV